jgi:CxxC motif-containing protein (DUF1111 family)
MIFYRRPLLAASCCFALLLGACGGGRETSDQAQPPLSSPDTTGAVVSLSSFASNHQEPPSADTVELQKEGGRLNALELARIAQTGVLPDPFEGPLLSGAASSKAQGQAKAATPTVAYRFYNTRTSAHFFTTSVAERDSVINTLSSIMNYEGPAFYASATSGAGLSPVHRFYNTQTGVHFYTISETERAHVVASLPQFTYEGISYYTSTQAGAGFTPLYRFFLASKGFHFYSNSSTERDNIIANLPQYTYEGIGYYVLDSGPTPAPLPVRQPVDMSNPGKVVTPVAATNSAQDGGHAPRLAFDGSMGTYWQSNRDDEAWLQFDFGQKVQVGYIKLAWENAYGKAYKIQTSDDGVTWVTLREIADGKGGTEELFNLGGNGRYYRMQGVTRGTQYGYALWEVEFKTSGSDNSMPVLDVSESPVPPAGSSYVPMLPAVESNPLESVSFTLPDGTLVTRFGVVGRGRHGRERGQPWNEVGFGSNGTVDEHGEPVNEGTSSAYLGFVQNYFKKRTWGMEIIDNSKVAGVTRPVLKINNYFQQGQFAGGRAFFRGFTNPNVTGFGWMRPGALVDGSLYNRRDSNGNLVIVCPVVPRPQNFKILDLARNGTGLNDGCSATIDEYPPHDALSYNSNNVLVPSKDVPGATKFYDFSTTWPVEVSNTSVPGRPLKVGDSIEMTPSFFSNAAAMAPDTGGHRYYTTELTYVVGVGIRPWYGVQPRLLNRPLPPETQQGGTGSVPYDYTNNGTFIFQQQQGNIGMDNMQRFVDGRRLIHTNMLTGEHNESGNDRYVPAINLLGLQFNQTSCFACHVNNGRSPAPSALNERLDSMAVRTAMLSNGIQKPHDYYGVNVQMNAISESGKAQDWGNSVRLAGFDPQPTITLAGGVQVNLRKPRLSFDGPVPQVFSLRAAQPLIGGGLLEAVPEADILARVRSTPDQDGVRGQANFVYDPETGQVRLGRFGWKAAKVSLRHQAASALLSDMSVTSPMLPSRRCLAGPAACNTATPERGITEAELTIISHYLQLVAVPAQRSLASGFPNGVAPLPDLVVNEAQVATGALIFKDTLRCTACHVDRMKTGKGHLMQELHDQTIKPYTDLLLHDMGPGLADDYKEGQAVGNQWRTAPLWGIGYTDRVMDGKGAVGYLHDGRARDLIEAILWHGGEAQKARDRFADLSEADRNAVLAFLKSL